MTTKSLLYVGAFLDCLPLVVMRDIERFVYIDASPDDKINHFPKPCLGYHEKLNFDECLKINLEYYDMNIVSFVKKDSNFIHILVDTASGRKEIYYFCNTVFPIDIDSSMLEIIKECQYLLTAGMLVDKKMGEYLKELPNIHTYFPADLSNYRQWVSPSWIISGYYYKMMKEYETETTCIVDFCDFNRETFLLKTKSNYSKRQS